MAHPLATQVETLAQPIAAQLGFELIRVSFHPNQQPPVLRVVIRTLEAGADTSHAHCEAMSRALEAELDQSDQIPGNYVLEISSPGVSTHLTSDREFEVFRGFPVAIQVDPPYKDKSCWLGNLVGRDHDSVHLSIKGRAIKIPREQVQATILQAGSE